MDYFPNIPKLSFVLFYRSILLQLYHYFSSVFSTSFMCGFNIIHWLFDYDFYSVSLSFYVVFPICSISLEEVRGKCFFPSFFL